MTTKEKIEEIKKLALKNGWKPGEIEAEAKRMNEVAQTPASVERVRKYLEMSEQPKMPNQTPQREQMSPEGKKALQEYQKKVEQAADQYLPERQKQKPEMSAEPRTSSQEPQIKKMSPKGKAARKEYLKKSDEALQKYQQKPEQN